MTGSLVSFFEEAKAFFLKCEFNKICYNNHEKKAVRLTQLFYVELFKTVA